MEQASADCVVIGAGVVGLAIARAMALAGREVLVLEQADAIGTGISARNSEVIHAGIYYPRDSLKARLCVAGKQMIYDFCESRGIEYRRCGKLIVACNDRQSDRLEAIREKAEGNGVDDLELLDARRIARLEPALNCLSALFSPSTGIVDSHGLMLSCQGEAEDHGAMIAFNSPVEGGEILPDGQIKIRTGGETPMKLICRTVINAAGLAAPELARRIAGMPQDLVPREYLCKGSYFTLEGRAPFSHLIYPMPNEAGLGVHLTLDLGGRAKFGPDTEWVAEIHYPVDPARGEDFYQAIRAYWPDLADGALQPGYSGIRPKISGPDDPAADFMIQGPDDHGIQGLVNLYGIESPGLTSSLAIADHVATLLRELN